MNMRNSDPSGGDRCLWQIAPLPQLRQYDGFCFDIWKGLTLICVLKAPAIWCNNLDGNKRFGIRALGASKWEILTLRRGDRIRALGASTWEILTLRRGDRCLWQIAPQPRQYDGFCFDIWKGLTLICVLKAPAIWCNDLGDNKRFGIRALGASKWVILTLPGGDQCPWQIAP